MFQNQKKAMFYQFYLIVIASLTCLTCVPGAKKIKFYEGPDLPLDKAATLYYNPYYLVNRQLILLDGYGHWNEKFGVADVLKTIDGKSADAFQKGSFEFILKPGPHTLAVDIKELKKLELNKLKTRLAFHFLEDLESNQTLAFEAEEGHKYELSLARISSIKLKDTLYISYLTALFVFDITDSWEPHRWGALLPPMENTIVSAKVPGAFPLKVQDKSLVFYDGEILPPEESALLQVVGPNLTMTEIIGETADGTKIVSELHLCESTIVVKPGKYKLKAKYFFWSGRSLFIVDAQSITDAVAEFTAEAGQKYQVKHKILDGGKWSLIIK